MFVKILEGASIHGNPVTTFLNDHDHVYCSSTKRISGRLLICSPGVVEELLKTNTGRKKS